MVSIRRPLDEVSFPDVLRAAKVGDEAAVEQLFVDLQPRLLRFLRSVEPGAADDIAGEVWLAIARAVGEFEGDLGGFRAWMFAIARHKVSDYRRSAIRRPATPTDDEFFSTVVSASDTEAEATDGLSGQAAVDLIVSSLPYEHAELLMLRILGDLDVRHVAEVMGRSPNWVRVNQHRALRRLAEVLNQPADGAENLPDHVIPHRSSAISTS